MAEKTGFNSEMYITEQSKRITQRVEMFDKLYLEFGGKLFDDYHATRVLPGFDLNAKVKLLANLKDQTEIIFCISAKAIEQNKVRSDVGITYDMDVLRLIDKMRDMGLYISAILITQYSGQGSADVFRNRLEKLGERVFVHTLTKGYPSDVNVIVSEQGYGANPFIETTCPLVIVTAPGPGSGKLATCLSQLYHEQKKGVRAGYAKYETFPVWNLPLQHPVNVAYEAATADLKDVNMIDPFHLAAYKETTVNYNRDIEAFPVVRTILTRITGDDIYKSPTDMGVNLIGECITDDEVVREAARQEIIRRWYMIRCANKQGKAEIEEVKRIEFLMSSLALGPHDRKVVGPANAKAAAMRAEAEKDEDTKYRGYNLTAVALELPDGKILTGKSSELMNDTAAVVLNSIKYLAGIHDEIMLISPNVLEPIIRMKKDILGSRYPVLKLEEVLQALSISAAMNPAAEIAISQLKNLKGCKAHCSNIITQEDVSCFLKLGINYTCEPEYPTTDLYFH